MGLDEHARHADRDGGDAFNRALQDKIADVSSPALRTALAASRIGP